MTKNRGACALTRAGGSLYTIKLKSACREPDLTPLGLGPSSSVENRIMGTRLLASLGSLSKGKNRTLLLASEMPVPIPPSRTVYAFSCILTLQVSFTPPTVRLRGMGTGISEASKRVPIFSCYPGRQASEFPFSTEELGPSPRGSDPVSCRLT